MHDILEAFSPPRACDVIGGVSYPLVVDKHLLESLSSSMLIGRFVSNAVIEPIFRRSEITGSRDLRHVASLDGVMSRRYASSEELCQAKAQQIGSAAEVLANET